MCVGLISPVFTWFSKNLQLTTWYVVSVFSVLFSALVSYTRVCVAVQLHTQEKDRDMALLLAGITTQLGAMLGAILFFVLVYFTDIFYSPV